MNATVKTMLLAAATMMLVYRVPQIKAVVIGA